MVRSIPFFHGKQNLLVKKYLNISKTHKLTGINNRLKNPQVALDLGGAMSTVASRGNWKVLCGNTILKNKEVQNLI